ncbi:MAG: hypothetical protein IIV48_08585 [Clostridium sp.]|nr:hypothetical protein [Clostridium sp.]
MKKKGNILLETIVAVNIILAVFLIVTSLIDNNIESFFKRRKIEEANRIIYCVMQEVKYNLTLDELLNLTKEKEFKLKLYDNFLIDISNTNLELMPKGNEIVIKAVNTDDPDKIEIELKVDLLSENETLYKNFNKYKWMDYYE